jgi:hypothetical protein
MPGFHDNICCSNALLEGESELPVHSVTDAEAETPCEIMSV